MSFEFEEWVEFESRVKMLMEQDPSTRLIVKYAHNKSRVNVRVTNDAVCLKFKTGDASDLRKFEKLHAWMLAKTFEMGEEEMEQRLIDARSAVEEQNRAAATGKKGGRRRRGGR
eukprot:CAMPEP_0118864352 /NCGR_PEP_ID=MMETSP1163-20130328/8960_1 /TAXON_ID=124430 /ORGANISM="Phaeomonas parva, Strain CCMP2877" /LENGTH=113 /DNA_ID=CAMNT_0006798463 /DNA_START=84 /DNA_END=425 /DNA_ORIENTATION=-